MARLTVSEAARAYRVSRYAIYRAINAGRMTVHRGRVQPLEVEQLIELGILRVQVDT